MTVGMVWCQYRLDGKDENEGGYLHLRFDTGELRWLEIG